MRSVCLIGSLQLTVTAMPVAMPAVLSVTMAGGALLLARKQSSVSRLSPSRNWGIVAVQDRPGGMLWLKRKVLSGSQAVLMSVSRE
jgi:hypothetical protein